MSDMPGYQLLEQSDFFRGITFSEPNGPYKSSRQVARIRAGTVFSIQPCQHNSTEEFYPVNEVDARYIHMGWPAPSELPARPWGVIYQEPKANPGNWVSRRMVVHRWTVSLRAQDLEPAKEFVTDVENALKASGSTGQMEALRSVFAAWGEMVPTVAVGGASLATTGVLGSKQTLAGDAATFRPPDRGPDVMQAIDRSLDITGNFERRFESRIQGGRPEIFSKSGFNNWLTDLVKNESSSCWRVVKVNQGIPVTDLLSKVLRQKINRLFSYGSVITRSIAAGGNLPLGFDCTSGRVKDIKQINVWYNADGMKDISVTYVDGAEAGPYGFGKAPANKPTDSFVLAPGEFITHVFVWNYNAWIKTIQFVKNTYEVSHRYGDLTDTGTPMAWNEGGCALAGFAGSYDVNWLTQLQAVWRHDIKAEDNRNIELQIVSGGTGTIFNDFRYLGDPSTSRISRFCFRNTAQPVAGFQVTYSSKLGGVEVHQETPVRGTEAGNRDAWTLAEDEHITQVKSKRVHNVVYQLEFTTNKGNTKKFGQDAGTLVTFDPPQKDMVLYFFLGNSGAYIQSLILAWGTPPV
ncbi:Jacalin-like lectin domain protein [Rhizoctonia solani]|uniref:Jacalin-like lectin domain protein n=1 Tax=Rhizoctonia solani TaxID=456999 RepID=A0A8H8P3Q9_9AGAM|nr:Jacalin-like lectin domain protein [Rhizoctonia solani]QRW23782.1 Jacalin-like lectin domain protein [Rhizoctonia solani]